MMSLQNKIGFSVLLSIYIKEDSNHFNESFTSIWDQQSLKPNEIVLVKDGPLTPALDAIIAHWKDKLGDTLIVSTLDENVGTGRAKNHGLNLCNYEYVAIMDTDDICTPDRFEKQINFLKENPDIVVLGGQLQEFQRSKKNIIAERKVPLSHQEILDLSHRRSPINHATVIFHKEKIIHIGSYHHHILMEDYNLWIRVLANGYKTANLPETLLLVRSDGIYGRRRGINYIKSEWQLFQLKRSLKFQSTPMAFYLFLIRGLPRLLPAYFLQNIYKLLRK